MTTGDDDLLFAPEDDTPSSKAPAPGPTWHVLVVDDDPNVHAVTLLALAGFELDGKRLEFEHAYDASQAREKLASRDDWAVVLLDVVMETDDAGLRVARWLRDERHDRDARIVLRTGQPGVAPERDLMGRFDINDYQPKADLSAQRLFTSVAACVRAFRDLRALRGECDALRATVERQRALLAAHGLASDAI